MAKKRAESEVPKRLPGEVDQNRPLSEQLAPIVALYAVAGAERKILLQLEVTATELPLRVTLETADDGAQGQPERAIDELLDLAVPLGRLDLARQRMTKPPSGFLAAVRRFRAAHPGAELPPQLLGLWRGL